MAIEIIEDVLQRPISRLPMQFKDKEGIEDLLSIFVEELFELQDVFSDINETLDLDVVEAFWLDRIGLILNESRSGDDDETYRKRLKMKVFFNKSEGTEEFVTEAIKFLTGGQNVQLTDAGFANLTAVTDGTSLDQEVVDELKRLLAATVILTLAATFDGSLFVTVDPDPFGDTDFVNPDSGLVDYTYNDSPDAGKWFQDYEELTTADITIDTAVVGEKHSVMINSNFVENSSSAADVDVAALELAALIDALDDVSASSSLDTITVTGAKFTLAAISQNTTMDPAWASTYGGVLVDVVDRTFDAADTSTGWNASEGTAQSDWLGFNRVAITSAPVSTPEFVAINDLTKDLYISDSAGADEIYVQTASEGSFVSISYPGSSILGMDVDNVTEVLWVTDNNDVLHNHDNGVWSTNSIGSCNSPEYVAVDSTTHNVYVTDGGPTPITNALFKVVGGSGGLVGSLGSYPDSGNPDGLAVNNTTGDVYVTQGDSVYKLPFGTSTYETVQASGLDIRNICIDSLTGDIWGPDLDEDKLLILPDGVGQAVRIQEGLGNPDSVSCAFDSTDGAFYYIDGGIDQVVKYEITYPWGDRTQGATPPAGYSSRPGGNYWTLHATFEADHIAFSPGGIQDVDDYLYMTRTSDNEVYRQNLSTGVVSQWGTFPGNVPGEISFRGSLEGVHIAEDSPTDALSDRIHSITDSGSGPFETSSDGFPSAAAMADVTESQFALISNAADPADSVLKYLGSSVEVQGSYPGSAPERLVAGGYDNQYMYVTEGNVVYKTDDRFTTSTAITISEITGIADIALDQSTGDVYIVDDSAAPSVYLLYKGFGTSFMRLGEPLPSTCIDIEIDQQTGDLWVNTSAGIYLHKVHQYQKYRDESHNLPNHQLSGLHWNSKGDTYAIGQDDGDTTVKVYLREFGTSTFVQDTTIPLPEPTSQVVGFMAVSTVNDDVFVITADAATFDFFIYRKFGGAGDWILEEGVDSQKYIINLCVDQQTGDFYYLALDIINPGVDTGVFVKPLGSISYSKKASLPTFAVGLTPQAVNVNNGDVYVSGSSGNDASCSVIPLGESSYQSVTPYANEGWTGFGGYITGVTPGGDLIWPSGDAIARSGSNYLENRRQSTYYGTGGGFYNDTNGETYTFSVNDTFRIFNDN